MKFKDVAQIYKATLLNKNINAEDLIRITCEAIGKTKGYENIEEYTRTLIKSYNEAINYAKAKGYEGFDIVNFLESSKDEIVTETLDENNNVKSVTLVEESLPRSINITGDNNNPGSGNFQFGDESTEGAKYLTNNEEFDSLDIGEGVASAPKEPGISMEQLNQLKKLAEEQKEQNNPDSQVNTGEVKEPSKDNIDFKDKPINDTKTGDFQFGDESTEGIKYLTNNEEFDSLDIDDGNDNTPPDEGNDNTPPSGPLLK